MLDIFLALAAGILTIAAPCVLPMLPIILGASVGRSDPMRPLLITFGFAVTFALVAFLFGLFPSVLGLSQEALREAAVIALFLFGVLMVWPHPFERLAVSLNGVLGPMRPAGATARSGKAGAVLLGASLGAVWAPCAGPVLGSILTLVASAKSLDRAALLLACYSAGAAIPMLLIAYGGQYISTRARGLVRYTRVLQQGFGVVIVLVAIATFFQYDAVITVWLSNFFPEFSTGL
ncbi:cytochrome c biogenesis CcdA family protein [soil metagenome]